jgi:hypothetical protein
LLDLTLRLKHLLGARYRPHMTQGNISPIQAAQDPIDPGVRIGHVHLRTADIDRVRDFYVGVLGFDVVAEERDVPGWGTTGAVRARGSRAELRRPRPRRPSLRA